MYTIVKIDHDEGNRRAFSAQPSAYLASTVLRSMLPVIRDAYPTARVETDDTLLAVDEEAVMLSVFVTMTDETPSMIAEYHVVKIETDPANFV